MAHERTHSESSDDNANFALLAKRADEESDETDNCISGQRFINLNDENNSDPSVACEYVERQNTMLEVLTNDSVVTQTLHIDIHGNQNTRTSMEWETTILEISTTNSIEQTQTLHSHSIQPESDALVQYSGTFVLVDSVPMHYALNLLRERLLKIGLKYFDGQVKLYPNEQGRDECGYISICSAFNLRKRDWEIKLSNPSLFNIPDKVIKMFNCMIGLHSNTGPIRLNDVQICEIVRKIEFLDVNFHLSHQLTPIDAAFNLFQRIRELKYFLVDASGETGNMGHEHRLTIEFIKQLLRHCLGRAKDGNFKSLLQSITNLIKSGRADYEEISRIFHHAVDNFSAGNWFAGVFSYEAFLRHIQEEIRATDRDFVVSKCAIVNTTEIPGEHWFAVGYEIRRHVATWRATDGWEDCSGRLF